MLHFLKTPAKDALLKDRKKKGQAPCRGSNLVLLISRSRVLPLELPPGLFASVKKSSWRGLDRSEVAYLLLTLQTQVRFPMFPKKMVRGKWTVA